MNNEELALQEFNEQHLEAFKNLKALTEQKKELEKQEKKIKDQILKQMQMNDIKSLENDYVKITQVLPSVSKSLDVKELEKQEPNLYKELMQDYTKTSERKGYVRITVK